MSNKNRPSGIARNAIANWLAFLFVAGVSFFLSPFIIRHLGNTAYGVWSLIGSLVGYLGLLDFGVRGAITRYVAHHHAASDKEGGSDIVSTGLVIFGFLGALATLISCVLAYISPFVFNIPAELVTDTRLILVVGGVTMATTLIGAVFGGVIAGLQRFDVSSGVEILMTTLRTSAIVFALLEGYGLVSLACINLASSVLNALIAKAIARRLYPELRLRFPIHMRSHIWNILSFSVWSSIIHISGVLIYYSDVLVIAMFLPVGVVTFYAIAGNLCDYGRQMVSAVSVLMTPRISAFASGGSDRIGDEILSAARLTTLVTTPIATTFWFRGESFINLWMGPEYGLAAGEVLRILAFVVLLGGARAVATTSIMGMNRHRTLAPIYGFEAVANLILSITLVGPLGLSGVALGTLIPSLIVNFGFLPHRFATATGVSVALFYRDSWLLPMLACLPFALANILMEHWLPAGNVFVFFSQVTLTLPLVVPGAIAFCLTSTEKKQMGAVIRRVVLAAR